MRSPRNPVRFNLFEFQVLHVGCAATNREHVTYVGISEALQENAAAYHAGRAEQDDPHHMTGPASGSCGGAPNMARRRAPGILLMSSSIR